MQPEPEVITKLVSQMIEVIQPLRIILFGSAVRGEMGADSDLDVLVVVPEGVHRRKTAQALYQQINGIGVPFDILVATPSDLEKHKDNIGLIYHVALREGSEVYVA
jgi:predicted nucleotidyltransferase